MKIQHIITANKKNRCNNVEYLNFYLIKTILRRSLSLSLCLCCFSFQRYSIPVVCCGFLFGAMLKTFHMLRYIYVCRCLLWINISASVSFFFRLLVWIICRPFFRSISMWRANIFFFRMNLLVPAYSASSSSYVFFSLFFLSLSLIWFKWCARMWTAHRKRIELEWVSKQTIYMYYDNGMLGAPRPS